MANVSTTTIKFGKDYDSPWLVLAGTVQEMRLYLMEAFDLEDEELPLSQLIVKASGMARGVNGVTTSLGGSIISTESNTPASTPKKEEASPYAGVIEEINTATDKASLQKVFAANNVAFANSPEVQAAFKAAAEKF